MTSLACESFDKTFSVTHTLVKTGVASGGSVTFGYVIGANFYFGTQQCWKPKCIFQIYIFCFFRCYFNFSVSLLFKLLKMFLLGCENLDNILPALLTLLLLNCASAFKSQLFLFKKTCWRCHYHRYLLHFKIDPSSVKYLAACYSRKTGHPSFSKWLHVNKRSFIIDLVILSPPNSTLVFRNALDMYFCNQSLILITFLW